MMALVDKLRRAREITVEAGDYVFTVRRPTDMDMVKLRVSGEAEGLMRFVVGWARKDGADFTEFDLGLPGAEPHNLAFDSETCVEWLCDRMDLYQVVNQGIVDAYVDHAKAITESRKN